MKYIFIAKNNDYISDLVWQLNKYDGIQILFAETLTLSELTEADKFYIPS